MRATREQPELAALEWLERAGLAVVAAGKPAHRLTGAELYRTIRMYNRRHPDRAIPWPKGRLGPTVRRCVRYREGSRMRHGCAGRILVGLDHSATPALYWFALAGADLQPGTTAVRPGWLEEGPRRYVAIYSEHGEDGRHIRWRLPGTSSADPFDALRAACVHCDRLAREHGIRVTEPLDENEATERRLAFAVEA